MTDHELLERAAQAAGYAVEIVQMGDDTVGRWLPGPQKKPGNIFWQPLREDGDALRLAIALGLQVLPYPIFEEPKHSVIVQKRYWDSDAERAREHAATLEVYDGEPEAATRRAIVRAAAELAA